jgi:para-aminobenzoate synthetase component 1
MDRMHIFQVDSDWIKKAVRWAEQHFPFMAYFDHNSLPYPHKGFDHILYAGKEAFTLDQLNLGHSHEDKVGILSYDLKNQFENLQSQHTPYIDCPDSLFFDPTLKILFQNQQAEILHPEASKIFEIISASSEDFPPAEGISIKPCTSQKEYIKNVFRIKEHILEGDIYEMNYCIAFKGIFKSMDPLGIFWNLKEKSPMPFSFFFKAKEKQIIGASPERFLKKTGTKIIAQPIKGTIKRGQSEEEDLFLRNILKNNEKERAENLMIVDLMRNDLSKISEIGQVKVEELFGIYPFKNITQMISTLSSTLKEPSNFGDIISKTFPMGSMTGAPKIKCMELIEKYENFRRGWFSGSMGYILKNGDFDFNVVIRSIILDRNTCRLYFAVGSAITYDADPEQEYQECLLKAKPILEVLSGI